MNFQTNCPDYFISHYYEQSFNLSDDKLNEVWQKLQRRETFVKGQIPPYQVEFETGLKEGNFKTGELNIHHGPLLSVHGAIGEINDHYRGLNYFYGSYVLSFRLVRPVKLEFYKESSGIKLKIHCYIAPWFKSPWEFGNRVFWKFFGISFLF